ncbi:MAG: MFS transporter [Bacillota bacterium]|nr:MFS transporter [Bacillota bacterium]
MLKSRGSKIAALLISHGANDGYSVILPPLLMVISLEFGLSTMQVATIISVFTLSSALAQLPVAMWGDYTGRIREILAAGLFVFSLALLGWGWSTSYFWLLFFAFLGGLGFSGYHPISMNLMTQQFSDRKGFSLGLHTVAGSMGATAVPAIIGFFSGTWRLGVSLMAVPGIFSALWILLTFGGRKAGDEKDKKSSPALKMTVLNPLLLLTASFGGVNQMVYWGSVTFIPLFFSYRFGWSAAATGALLGAFHFSAIVSQPLFGYLSDLLDRNRLLLILGSVNSLFCILLFLTQSPAWSSVFCVCIGASVLALRALVSAKVSDLVAVETRSTAIGVIFTFSSGMGALAPLIGGYMEQLYSYQAAFLVFGLFSFIGLGFLLVLGRLEKKREPVHATTL